MNSLKQLWWKLPGWLPFWNVHVPYGVIDRRLPTVELLKQDASKLRRILKPVISNDPYLSIFRMNMEEDCPLWARSNLCTSGNSCTIESCCLEDVPPQIKEQNIIKISQNTVDPWLQLESDSAFPSSLFEAPPPEDTFFDLAKNSPGNTNYRGRSLWGYIYENNCLHNGKLQMEDATFCSEEGAYFKMISGMQTVIAALNAEHSDDNALIPFNLTYFKNAVSWNESWISNLYFTFGMLQRSACKIAPLLDQLQCPTPSGSHKACDTLVEFLEENSESCKVLEAMPTFIFDSLAVNAVQKLSEMSTIMNCVECEKCRLHAKVKINALQTVVKATSPNGVVSLERNEIVAFLHALDYFAEGVEIVTRFQNRLHFITLTASGITGLLILCIRIALESRKSKNNEVEKKKTE